MKKGESCAGPSKPKRPMRFCPGGPPETGGPAIGLAVNLATCWAAMVIRRVVVDRFDKAVAERV